MIYDVTVSLHSLTFKFDTTEHEDFNTSGQDDPDKLDPTDTDVVQDYIREFISDNSLHDLAGDEPIDVDEITVKAAEVKATP